MEGMSWVKNTMLGVENSHDEYSDYDSSATYVAEAGYVVTGFGGRVGSNGNFSRIAVERMRLSDGSIDYKLIGDIDGPSSTFNEENYEQFARVPKGHALVGMAVREHDKGLSNLVLYSQEIVAGRPTSHYLEAMAEVVTVSAGGTHDGYAKIFNPHQTNNMAVIVGLAITSSNDGDNVSNLLLEIAELQSE